ncbi:MAG TPA: hypothetical protein VMB25_18400 [Bryobacteraceae bacterium]|nr:hypothetical protein [Bryobacteraceae bacterium]
MLTRYLIPLAPFLLIALCSISALIFFLRLDIDARRLKSVCQRRHRIQEAAIQELQRRLEDMGERLRETEERAGVLTPPLPKSGLNLNKRSQAIRMSRRGEGAQHIAASLQLPQREVELLLKVYGLVLDRSREPSS